MPRALTSWGIYRYLSKCVLGPGYENIWGINPVLVHIYFTQIRISHEWLYKLEVERKRNLNIDQIFVYSLYLEICLSDSDSWDINPIIPFFVDYYFHIKLYAYKAILFSMLKEKYTFYQVGYLQYSNIAEQLSLGTCEVLFQDPHWI